MVDYKFVDSIDTEKIIGVKIREVYYDGPNIIIELNNELAIIIEDANGWGEAFAIYVGKVIDDDDSKG